MTAKDIEKYLYDKYSTSLYNVSNIYFFEHPYKETDFLVIQNNGHIYDIEIKISKADFKADFKKISKHSILDKGTYVRPYTTFGRKLVDGEREIYLPLTPIPAKNRPNRFYYAVPENLINVKEIPSYAGLLYIKANGEIIKVKEAPLLTKEKVEYSNILARKFYFDYLELKKIKSEEEYKTMSKYIKYLEKENKKLSEELKTVI